MSKNLEPRSLSYHSCWKKAEAAMCEEVGTHSTMKVSASAGARTSAWRNKTLECSGPEDPKWIDSEKFKYHMKTYGCVFESRPRAVPAEKQKRRRVIMDKKANSEPLLQLLPAPERRKNLRTTGCSSQFMDISLRDLEEISCFRLDIIMVCT